MQTPLYCRPSPLIHSFSIITSCSLFPQYLLEQTTFYNSASYCGRLHCSRLRFAHCRDMHCIAPYGALHVFDTAAQAPTSSLAVAHKRLGILVNKILIHDFILYHFRVKMSGSLLPRSLWKQLFPRIF